MVGRKALSVGVEKKHTYAGAVTCRPSSPLVGCLGRIVLLLKIKDRPRCVCFQHLKFVCVPFGYAANGCSTIIVFDDQTDRQQHRQVKRCRRLRQLSASASGGHTVLQLCRQASLKLPSEVVVTCLHLFCFWCAEKFSEGI